MKRGIETAKPKIPYEKPSITRVALRPEEAVLTICKATGVCTKASHGS